MSKKILPQIKVKKKKFISKIKKESKLNQQRKKYKKEWERGQGGWEEAKEEDHARIYEVRTAPVQKKKQRSTSARNPCRGLVLCVCLVKMLGRWWQALRNWAIVDVENRAMIPDKFYRKPRPPTPEGYSNPANAPTKTDAMYGDFHYWTRDKRIEPVKLELSLAELGKQACMDVFWFIDWVGLVLKLVFFCAVEPLQPAGEAQTGELKVVAKVLLEISSLILLNSNDI